MVNYALLVSTKLDFKGEGMQLSYIQHFMISFFKEVVAENDSLTEFGDDGMSKFLEWRDTNFLKKL